MLLIVACGEGGPVTPPGISEVSIDAPVTALELGDSTQLAVTVRDASGAVVTGRPVVWQSSNPSIAHVGSTGIVVAVRPGSATVSASVEGRTASVTLQVHDWNIADDVVVIDSTRLSLVSDSAELAAGRLRFDVLQAGAATLVPGAVVVGTQRGGFLRRVTTVSQTGGGLTVETEPAALSDVIEAGAFTTTIDLFGTPGVPAGALSQAVARLQPGEVVWGEGVFTYMAPGLTAQAGFDLSGIDVCEILKAASSLGAATCPDGIEALKIASGRIDFEPDIELSASFDGFDLEEFRGVAKGALGVDVGIQLEVSGSLGSFDAKPKMFTFSRPFYAQIGPVPVIGYVEMEVEGNIGIKASAKGSIEAGFTANGSVELGAKWADSWEDISESSGSFEPRTPSFGDGTLDAAIEIEASVSMKPRLQVIFYGVIGPFAQVEPFGKATLTFGTQACGLKAETGIKAAIGFTIPFLDDDVADFDYDWDPLIEGPGNEWSCPLGTLDVGVSTSGENPDTDGYTILVDDVTKAALPSNGRVSIENVQTGTRTVALDGVASNCTVDPLEQTVEVTAGGLHTVDFAVECTALTGNVEISTRTTGSSPDPDGYRVSVGGTIRDIGNNQTLLFEDVAAGLVEVQLSDVASNCDVTGGSTRLLQVVAGVTTAVQFDVACGNAELVVTTVTEGPPATSTGWTVTLDGAQTLPITPNGQATFATTPGTHNVLLAGLPQNCTVDGPNPRTVDVSGTGSTQLEIGVTCEAAGLTVIVTTDGDAEPATSYLVHAGGESRNVGVNGSVSFPELPAGSVSVLLDGVPDHCTVQGVNPRDAEVPGSVTFEVVCQQPAQCGEPPPNGHSIWSSVGVFPNDEDQPWSTNTAEFTSLTWGEVAGLAAAASSDPDRWSKSSVADTEWQDRIFFVPIDAERMDEWVELRYRHTGHAEITRSGDARTEALVLAHGDANSPRLSGRETDEWETPQRIDFDNIVTIPVQLGQWNLLWGQVTLRADATGAASTSASGASSISFIDVRDSNGLLVPVAEICTSSGTSYE